jgi:hypothetical protein
MIHFCSECNFKSKDFRKLDLHRKMEHLKTVTGIKCEHCDYLTPLNANMRVHMKKHRKCSNCDYVSKNLPDLKKHTKGVHGFDLEVTIIFFRLYNLCRAVVLNRCAATQKCAVEFVQVCRQILNYPIKYLKNSTIYALFNTKVCRQTYFT